MTLLGKQTLNSGSQFALSFLRHEELQKVTARLKKKLWETADALFPLSIPSILNLHGNQKVMKSSGIYIMAKNESINELINEFLKKEWVNSLIRVFTFLFYFSCIII